MTADSATTTVWTGSNSNLWSDELNWTNGLPRKGITTIINTDASKQVDIDLGGSSYEISGMQITGGGEVKLLDGSIKIYIQQLELDTDSHLTLDNVTVDAIYKITATGTIGAVTGGSIAITNGSNLSANYITSNISFSGPRNEIYQFWSGHTIPKITNITADDYILFSGNEWAGVYWSQNSDGSYRIVDTSDNVLVSAMYFAPGTTPSDFHWIRPYGSGYAGLVCFLPGTMIRTPAGDVRVEDLSIGDSVTTVTKTGETSTSPVSWIGKARAEVSRTAKTDDASSAPIRILKDAISDGVPNKDLLITPEHCLYFNGKFIPARMLVNNITIFYDKSFVSYEYYHIETARHSVIIADGMTSESYLDTGNRGTFSAEGKTESKNLEWGKDSFADLDTSSAFVSPIYHEIKRRACDLHSSKAVKGNDLTSDPDLRLATKKGEVIYPLRAVGTKFLFLIPDDATEIQITSNASRPSDVIGPFVDDRRFLGVAVGDIAIITPQGRMDVNSHKSEQEVSGWHAPEGDARWTDGSGKIVFPDHASVKGRKMLSIEIKSCGPYLKAA